VELEYSIGFLRGNPKAMEVLKIFVTYFLAGSIVCLSGCIGIEDENKDSDNDGIIDRDEIKVYRTDPKNQTQMLNNL